jgi:Polyketide cyclase / dehydrase and lipid transport
MFKPTCSALLIVAALVALPPAANAGSIAVGKKLEVNVDPKRMAEEKTALWAKFGGWCSIKDWHPAIADCVESKDGETIYRTLTLKDGGGTIKEKQLEMVEGRYKYEIIESPLPVKSYQAQFALTPDDDDDDEINFAWSAVFDPADGKTPEEARKVIDGIFKAGLDNVKAMTAPKGGAKADDDDDDKKKK